MGADSARGLALTAAQRQDARPSASRTVIASRADTVRLLPCLGQRGAVVDVEPVDPGVGKDPVSMGVGSEINVDGGALGSAVRNLNRHQVQGNRSGQLGVVNALSVPAGPENTGLLGLGQTV